MQKFSKEEMLEPFQRHYAPTLPVMRRIQRLDLMTYCSAINISLADKAGMWNSLEVRVPFLDRRIVEWTLRKPVEKLEYEESKSKIVLRRYLRDRIPDEILSLPKMGFRIHGMDGMNWGSDVLEEIRQSWWIKNGLWDSYGIAGSKFSQMDTAKQYTLLFLSRWADKWMSE
jgi:asparagine synthase (glutamine-hydrolysing)|tara:strand:- start:55 stop:567 length:513 start_codon:yes stop_codon:yes gene_type:complete